MVPTVLDLLDIEPPATIRGVTQSPLQGVSFAHTLDDAARREPPPHPVLRDARPPGDLPRRLAGGLPVARDRRSPRPASGSATRCPPSKLAELDATGWELYHVDEDFAENHNVAEEHRDRLIALIGTWYAEAGRYDVLPIDGSGLARMVAEKPLVAPPRDRYVYRPDTQSVPFFAGPRVLNRPHSITADVEIPDGGAEGVLLCQGTAAGGYSFFIKDGKLHYVHNYVGRSLHGVASPDAGARRARTSSASSSSPPGSPTWPTAAARPGGCSSTSTGRWSATPRRR